MTIRSRGYELLDRGRSEWLMRGPPGRSTERSLVWMLGSPRTGSTWLLYLLATHPRVVPVDEPGIGYHLGMFAADAMGAHPWGFEEARVLLPHARADDRQYFFSRHYENVWRPRLRRLILARMQAQIREGARQKKSEHPIAVIKEPAGSQVADFLFTVLPESRLLFLVRDGRDVLDSALDAVRRGSWLTDKFGGTGDISPDERLGFLQAQAHRWLARTESVQRAYNRLPNDQRFLIRYEDLRVETENALREILAWLGLDYPEAEFHRRVAELSFEAVPEAERGEGKFVRAASPGMWRESLTAAEQDAIHEIMGDALVGLGYSLD
jgi:sulfotransferase family protein